MAEIFPGRPKTASEASAYLFSVTKPTLDDLKMMVLLEAAGQGFYEALCDAAPNAEIKALLAKNGQEEMGHAHRLVKVIKQLHGEDFPVPGPSENPFYGKPAGLVVSKEMLDGITKGEIGGEALYEGWAVALGDEEVARQLRRNGKEERGHGERAQQAAALLAA